MKIDWLDKLRFLLHTLAFCLAISAIQYAFRPDRAYEVPLVYSLCIGLTIWALIDFGRHLFPSARNTGWPHGLSGAVLTTLGIIGGYLLGTLAADQWFGWSTWNGQGWAQLRLSVLITALAGVAGTYYFHSRGKSAWLEARMQEAQRQGAEARLKLLETQLEPHMLFNTLANLRVLIATDPARAQHMLDRMIAYLRATLAASRASLHPLQAEFDRLQDYLELMSVRMGDRLGYELDLPAGLAGQPVPALLLQPLVENSIRHGLEPQVAGGRVTVRASRAGGRVVLEVADTGAGLGESLALTGQGFGLTQVKERLATAYGAAGALELLSAPGGGTVARITLPTSP